MTKSPGLFVEEERDGRSEEGREAYEEQLREIEHEYVGLVLPAREDEGRRTAEERRGARGGERRRGKKERGEREREIGGGGPFALF